MADSGSAHLSAARTAVVDAVAGSVAQYEDALSGTMEAQGSLLTRLQGILAGT